MRPLKILHVIWSAEMGGISKVVLHLCQEQKKDSSLSVSIYIAKGKGEIIYDFNNLKIFYFRKHKIWFKVEIYIKADSI